jgi:anti-sigma B factor antagonist
MHIEDDKLNNVLIVNVLDKRLDASIAYEFKDKMAAYISRGEHLIVLRISDVDYIDSSGLGAIVSSLKMLDDKGDIVICGTKDTVMRMFKLTRMNKVFRMFETENEAIDALL